MQNDPNGQAEAVTGRPGGMEKAEKMSEWPMMKDMILVMAQMVAALGLGFLVFEIIHDWVMR